MSVFRWRYTEECEGRYCCGDCDKCDKEDEPVDDLISRQAAIEALENAGMTNYQATGNFYGIVNALTVIKNMPTAEPRKGKWIIQSDTYHEYWECDQCGMGVGLDDVRNYCPNCGARMEE